MQYIDPALLIILNNEREALLVIHCHTLQQVGLPGPCRPMTNNGLSACRCRVQQRSGGVQSVRSPAVLKIQRLKEQQTSRVEAYE